MWDRARRVIEYKPLIDGAIELSEHKPESVVILQRPEAAASLIPGRDFDWNEFQLNAEPIVSWLKETTLRIFCIHQVRLGAKGVVRPTVGT